MRAERAFVLLLIGWSQSASAQELRDFCADRPGLGTPSCTIDRNLFALEVGVIDWTVDRDAGSRTDSLITGDLLVRYGLSDSLEAQIGWQAVGTVRERSSDGAVDYITGTSDVRIALRQNVHNPDGSGFSIAVMPFVTLPTGGSAFGQGEWSAGVLLPISYAYSEDVQLAFTGGIDHAADEIGDGHHLALSGVVGIATPLTEQLSATLEFAVERDEERAQPSTQWLGGLSIAWLRTSSFQLDAGAVVGLNRQTPDLELYFGFARRF